MGKYDESIINSLNDEPMSPTEIANKLGINQKTVQSVLFQLVASKSSGIGYKKVGRTHLFWRKH